MPAQLSLAAANVTDDTGQQIAKKQMLTIRGTTMRLGEEHYYGVAAVVNTGRGRWTVRFVTGETFDVARAGGCGCGGRR